MEKTKPDLERDLMNCQFIKEKVRNDNGYATNLYSALCNVRWYHNSHVHSGKKSNTQKQRYDFYHISPCLVKFNN